MNAGETRIEKPPLGIKPKWLWKEERLLELVRCISRHAQASAPVKQEWIDEMDELIREVLQNQRPNR